MWWYTRNTMIVLYRKHTIHTIQIVRQQIAQKLQRKLNVAFIIRVIKHDTGVVLMLFTNTHDMRTSYCTTRNGYIRT